MTDIIFWVVGCIVGIFLLWFLIFRVLGLTIIKSDEVGIVEIWLGRKKGQKDNNSVISLNGEAGYQPDLLKPGIHLRSVFKYKIHRQKLITIPQGQIGYVFARDGEALKPSQSLGKIIDSCNNFQSVRAFLENGGQKGPQRGILREGTYAFNTAQFIIITESQIYYLPIGNDDKASVMGMANDIWNKSNPNPYANGFRPIVIEGESDLVGVVTTKDGPSLPEGDIIAPVVGNDKNLKEIYHNNFQDIEKFLAAGGYRGRQLQVITDGKYYINRLFASVELVKKTIIDVGYVGVVNSFTGAKGKDQSDVTYTHGELVASSERGVWKEPLMAGKYALNPYAIKVFPVPTTNFILKWNSKENGKLQYDSNLKEVSLITKDAFEPLLPLSVVVHIDYKKAPLVIQRFGDIKMLVEQTLDPLIGTYFKNIGQTKTLIELVQNRTEIQLLATEAMKEKFEKYNLELEEVLVGTPSGEKDPRIEDMLTQLRDRQIAREKIETYKSQKDAADMEKTLREAEAVAKQQTMKTESLINIEIQANQGKAELERSIQEAKKIETIAMANANKTKFEAEAQAELEARVGIGKAIAIEEQVRAYGGPQYQVTQDVMDKFTKAIATSGIDIVPKNVITMGNSAENGHVDAVQSLLTVLLSKEIGVEYKPNENHNIVVEEIKKSIIETINSKDKDKKESKEVREESEQTITTKDIKE
ncbi:SPFH domain-containing protein [Clostridium sp. 'White wine YQ']|uniref:SPFH domain-containing protein n=1 Tax=Clostridium sp. 'White wine YQ' TaxID=3027474 RepID=UPI00236590E9|nr:SPFH domain-containing protein [Clostridium sp. 'White wine YQ']MDD7793047.1 SPFH domain-containing protein [Clostridium sp. 'White wine YQ']